MTDPAERDGSAPPWNPAPDPLTTAANLKPAPSSPADLSLRLPGLAPAAASLAALASPPAAGAWSILRTDPAAVLLLLRQPAAHTAAPPALTSSEHWLDGPGALESALAVLGHAPFADWSDPRLAPVHSASLDLAVVSLAVAGHAEGVDPDRAWAAGLLAPLAWQAVSAVAPDAVASALADPELTSDPAGTTRRHWGLDASALARRLARRWGLPGWLTGVVGHLALPAPAASALGGDGTLQAIVRQTVRVVRSRGTDLGLGVPDDPRDDDRLTGPLDPAELPHWDRPAEVWESPAGVPLLRPLLELAAQNRALGGGPAARVRRLEWEADALHDALGREVDGAAARLESAKLSALAEFAAGAGHEINNPLAVISGQAQYLIGHDDWFTGDGAAARRCLDTIIAQTRRVHAILRDLMLFARPPAARPEWVDVPTLLGNVAAAVEEVAGPRGVRVEVSCCRDRLSAHTDPAQVKTVLTCLLRNAVEAATPGGWARLVLRAPAAGVVEVAVEDSGPGVPAAQRAALFDPFFSGRSAGRGRGLGLPVAWRLARLQGGAVRLEAPRAGEPTRFVLSLPDARAGSGPGPEASVGPARAAA